MTHEDFKQRINRSNQWTREQILAFLDGEFDNPILLRLFEIWKTGDNVKLFDEMKLEEQLFQGIRSNRNIPKSALVRPKDADLPRRKLNNNMGEINVSR